jgi:ribonuclease HI
MFMPKKVSTMPDYKLYFDGASRGNPGPAGAGAVLYADGVEKFAVTAYVGDRATNNEAEYYGLLIGLQTCVEEGLVGTIRVYGDSQLVIRQMKGMYAVKHPRLIELHSAARELIRQLGGVVTFEHVLRGGNARADALSNKAIDER